MQCLQATPIPVKICNGPARYPPTDLNRTNFEDKFSSADHEKRKNGYLKSGGNNEKFHYSVPQHKNESDQAADNSHLSFLYDKAQGSDYTSTPNTPKYNGYQNPMNDATLNEPSPSIQSNKNSNDNCNGQSSGFYNNLTVRNRLFDPQYNSSCNESHPSYPNVSSDNPLHSVDSDQIHRENKTDIDNKADNILKTDCTIGKSFAPPLPPDHTHPLHQNLSPNISKTTIEPYSISEQMNRRSIDRSPINDNLSKGPQAQPSLQRSGVTNSPQFSTSMKSPSSLPPKEPTASQNKDQDMLKKQAIGEMIEKKFTLDAFAGSRESLRNYDTWKAAVNKRKMSLPGCLTGSRISSSSQQTLTQLDDSASSPKTHHSSASTSNCYGYVPRSRCTSSASSANSAFGELDSTSIRHQLREGDDPLDDYDQTSIRYKGRTNPSKTFRMLQSVTGCENESEIIARHLESKPPTGGLKSSTLRKSAPQSQDGASADDIVDISYVGSSIPSRTFRQLQEAMGEPVSGPLNTAPFSAYGRNQSTEPSPTRNVRVIHLRRFSAGNVLEM